MWPTGLDIIHSVSAVVYLLTNNSLIRWSLSWEFPQSPLFYILNLTFSSTTQQSLDNVKVSHCTPPPHALIIRQHHVWCQLQIECLPLPASLLSPSTLHLLYLEIVNSSHFHHYRLTNELCISPWHSLLTIYWLQIDLLEVNRRFGSITTFKHPYKSSL